MENLLDLIYEHYTENNPVEKNTVAGKAAKAKEKELEEWLRGLEGMDRLVDDYVGDKIPLWEKIMDRQGTVCCTWEKTAFEEGLKVGGLVLGVRPRQSKLTKALPRYKSGIRIPTRVVLEKYAAALGKHIKLRINDEE